MYELDAGAAGPIRSQTVVWTVDLDRCGNLWTSAIGLVSDATRERAMHRLHPRDRARTVIAEFLLLALLDHTRGSTGRSPCRTIVERDKRGKPVLNPDDGVHVSISHSGRAVTVAISPEEIGVDVQSRGISGPWLEWSMTPQERLMWTDREDNRYAFRCWCRKESLLKMLGVGLTVDPRGVDCWQTAGVRLYPEVAASPVFFTELEPFPEHLLVVATRNAVDVNVCNVTDRAVGVLEERSGASASDAWSLIPLDL